MDKPVLQSKLYQSKESTDRLERGTIQISRILLETFNKKDATRVEAEQASEQRARKEAYDRFTEEINAWTKSIDEVSYTKGKTWQGKDAIRVFGTQDFTAKQLKNIPHPICSGIFIPDRQSQHINERHQKIGIE